MKKVGFKLTERKKEAFIDKQNGKSEEEEVIGKGTGELGIKKLVSEQSEVNEETPGVGSIGG